MTNKDYTTDTSPEARRLQLELIRQQSPTQRLKATFQMSSRVCRQCKEAIRRNNPQFSEDDVRIKFIEVNYGKDLAEQVRLWRDSRLNVE